MLWSRQSLMLNYLQGLQPYNLLIFILSHQLQQYRTIRCTGLQVFMVMLKSREPFQWPPRSPDLTPSDCS
jgi:hypothetical protein